MGNKRRMILSGGSGSSGGETFDLTGAEPRLKITETDQSANRTLWDIDVEGAVFSIRTRTDADLAGVTALSIIRGAGTAITSINTGAPLNVMGVGITGVNLHVASTGTTDPRGIISAQHNTGVDGARFSLQKSRDTEAAPTIIVTGDAIGKIFARGYDGANYLAMASIEFISTGTIAATRVPTQILFKTATNAAPSVLTTALTLDADQSATFAGVLNANGGIESTSDNPFTVLRTTSGSHTMTFAGSQSGTSNYVRFLFSNNAGNSNDALSVRTNGTGFTTVGPQIQDGSSLLTGSLLAGGLTIGTIASAILGLYTNDTLRIAVSGDGTACTFGATTNLLLGATAVGTSGVTVLAIKNGTAPSTAPTDTLQIFSEDVSAGNAVLAVFQEMAPYAGIGVASTTKVPVRWNGVTYYLLATTVA